MPELRGVLQHPELHARYATASTRAASFGELELELARPSEHVDNILRALYTTTS